MAFDFPNSPTIGQTYTSAGVTYKWDGQAWIGGPIVDSGAFQPKDVNLSAIAALPDNAVGYPELDGLGGSIAVPKATIAEFRQGTATPRLIGNKTTWDAAAEVVLTFAPTMAIDFATFLNAFLGITGALLLDNPVNLVLGRSGVIRCVNATGAAIALTWGSNWNFTAGAKPSSIPANSVYLLAYYAPASNLIFASWQGPWTNA